MSKRKLFKSWGCKSLLMLLIPVLVPLPQAARCFLLPLRFPHYASSRRNGYLFTSPSQILQSISGFLSYTVTAGPESAKSLSLVLSPPPHPPTPSLSLSPPNPRLLYFCGCWLGEAMSQSQSCDIQRHAVVV